MSKQIQSVEPQIADLANGWLRSYKLTYKLEQEEIGNSEIDNALNEYFSKNGGVGGNRPDAKLLLSDKWGDVYPILIEYKGYKDKLIKLDDKNQVANKTSKNEPDFKNINSYALNGAVHYANAILHYTSFSDIIAVGMSGYKDDFGVLQHEIAVYLVSKSNFGVGQEVGKFSDFSFLKPENFDNFIDKVKALNLSDEQKAQIKEKLEEEISTSLTKLNNDIYKNESGLGENDRVYLVTASIIATLGIPGVVKPLEKNDLKSLNEDGNRDGDIIMQKVKAFLKQKDIPDDKKALITRTLENTILSENVNKVINGETQLKRVFGKIVDDLGIYYKTDLSTDFTGKLFNEMYSWLGFSQDKLNDVVLTPSYIATLLARLARVDKDSYVWDFATGSAGLLVAAMNEMINNAKNEINSPDELKVKIAHIKAKQLLGLEILPSIYMLAILNMILMGDGSSNILNKDSLNDFSGNYGFGENDGAQFPATAFILNPPYSAPGNGMVFVQKALEMMKKGYAAIIIQGSAGTGKASGYNKKILEQNTLIASIKMPIDLFIGKSSVQTYIYVFRVGEKHNKDEIVKFIDFSNDGYTRANRKKAKAGLNLRDTDNAKARYDELVNLVRFGRSKLNIFSQKEYHEESIDPNNGSDWNKSTPIDTTPTLNDFKKCVSDYLAWEVSNIIKNEKTQDIHQKDLLCSKKLESTKWGEFRIGDLFEKLPFNKLSYKKADLPSNKINDFVLPAITCTAENNGISCYVKKENATIFKNCISVAANGDAPVFYQSNEFTILQDAYVIDFKYKKLNEKENLFFTSLLKKALRKFDWANKSSWEKVKNEIIKLPITQNGEIDFDFMENFVRELEENRVRELKAYLKATGLGNSTLNDKEAQAIQLLQDSINGGAARNNPHCSLKWQEFKIGDLFEIKNTFSFNKEKLTNGDEYDYVTRTSNNQGILQSTGFVNTRNLNEAGIWSLGLLQMDFFYRKRQWYAGQFVRKIIPKIELSQNAVLFFTTLLNCQKKILLSVLVRDIDKTFNNLKVQLPITQNGEIDFDFMESFIKAMQKECIKGVDSYLQTNINTTKKIIAN